VVLAVASRLARLNRRGGEPNGRHGGSRDRPRTEDFRLSDRAWDSIPVNNPALERDDFSSNRHPALSFCLSMISAQTLRVCRVGKPVPTFPDHAQLLSPTPIVRRSVLALIKIATMACVMLITVSMRNSVLLKMARGLTPAAPSANSRT
jgi:hypothetical protein